MNKGKATVLENRWVSVREVAEEVQLDQSIPLYIQI